MPTAVRAIKRQNTPAKAAQKVAADSWVGMRAPNFTLMATKVGKVSSASLKGRAYVLYFYPKDDTSGCAAEASAFQAALPLFSKEKLALFGVSKDDLLSHEKFSKKYALGFPLVSDPTGNLCEKYGVWKQKSMYGRSYMGIERSTFLIDGKGTVRASWRNVSVPGHVDEVMLAIKAL